MNRLRSRASICAALFVLLSLGSGRADELDDLVKAVHQHADTLSAKPNEHSSAGLRLLTELQAALSHGDLVRIQTAAQQLSAIPSIPPELIATAERVSRELPRVLEARADAFITAVDAAVERTRKECPAAKTEGDLTPLLRELSLLAARQPTAPQASAIVARALRKLDAATKTTESWMDYLAVAASGNEGRAREVLRRAVSDASAYPILPQHSSEGPLRTSASDPGTSAAILAIFGKIKTLRDVETAAPEMEALAARTPEGGHAAGIDIAKRWFNSFHAATAAFLAGDLGEAWRGVSYETPWDGGSWYPQALRLRGVLLEQLIPKYLKLPPGAERRPDETPTDHFRRLLAEAASEGRWADVHRMSSNAATGALLSGSRSSGVGDTASAVGAFLLARQLEEAGDMTGAIAAYERVLRSTADLAPVRETIARLKTLRETHPQAFAEVHPRIESDRVMQLIAQLERTLGQFTDRLVKFEQERVASRSAPPPGASPERVTKVDFEQLKARLADLEKREAPARELDSRLERLEVLLGPGAEALARHPDDPRKFRIWLAPDYTVYRSALPPKLERNLGWIVRFDGKQVLSRVAANEFAYRYYLLRPGNYSIFLTLGSDVPASNVLEFTISEEQAAKLPKLRDSDLDRDGVPNADEANDQ